MKKKIMAVLLSCALVLGMAVSPVGMETVKAEETTKTTADGFVYRENDDSSVTIVGYTGSESTVSIPSEIDEKKVKGICGFEKCTSLISVTIPEGVIYVHDRAFFHCTNLVNVTIPSSVITIGSSAFDGCTSLMGIDLPEGLEIIDDCAFSGTGLTSIKLPSTLKEIDQAAFAHTGLTNITIPASVSTIGCLVFAYCENLTQVLVDENNPNFLSENGILYNKGKTAITCCWDMKKEKIFIPDSVTQIENSAFCDLSNLTSIAIPVSVTGIGWMAFYGSNNLKDIYYAGSQEQWEKIKLLAGMYEEEKTITKEDLGIGDSVTIHYNSTMPAEPDLPAPTPDPIQKIDQSITAKNITKTYGAKSFSLGAKTNAGTNLTYSVSDKKVATVDKKGKVTIKGCGITNIAITAQGTDTYNPASKTIKLTVKPKKVTVSSVKSTKKKTAAVKWKQDKKASGYIIQCATDSKFKKNKVQVTVNKNKTVSATVKKLKAGKKYYVRVCAFAKSGKAKVQGDWSKAKTVKVKK